MLQSLMQRLGRNTHIPSKQLSVAQSESTTHLEPAGLTEAGDRHIPAAAPINPSRQLPHMLGTELQLLRLRLRQMDGVADEQFTTLIMLLTDETSWYNEFTSPVSSAEDRANCSSDEEGSIAAGRT